MSAWPMTESRPAVTEAAALRGGGAPIASVPELPELLRMFNEVSGRLSETHRRLEERVAGLQRELAEAHEGLRRSRALASLGEMAAGIAHEVRNPLASIALHAEVLRDDLADRPEQVAVLAKIHRAVSRLDSIVGDVLRFARGSGMQPSQVPVRRLVDEALASCQAELDGASVAIEVRVPASLDVLADGASITQALVNVVRNAVEAMREAGVARPRVRIDAARRERLGADGRRAPTTVIGVEDSGPGFDPSLMARIFTPFVTTRADGTGLGLAIVHRILDAHSGAVTIVPRGALGGARVELMLPAPDAIDGAPPREPGEARPECVEAAVTARLDRARRRPAIKEAVSDRRFGTGNE